MTWTRLAWAGPIVLLSACGGGGGSVGSTPAPTPTPPPVRTNAALVQPTVDERFVNDAVSATVTKDGSGALLVSAAPSNLTIDYVFTTNSYTLSNGARSQSFLPSERSPTEALSDSYITGKTGVDGNDRLELSYPGSAPIHSFKYVGGILWTSGDTAQTRLRSDAAAFGVTTPSTAVPRAGSGSYIARLMGQGFWERDYTYLDGVGQISANFANGTLNGSGNAIESSTNGGRAVASGGWTMNAQVSSASNGFTGTLTYSSSTNGTVSGNLAGRFYGPAAEELGGSFALNGTSALGRGSLVGVLLGGAIQDNVSLAPLTTNQTFAARSQTLRLLVNPTDRTIADNSYQDPTPGPFPSSLTYRAADNSYVLNQVPPTAGDSSVIMTASTVDPAASNARFVSYVASSDTTTERLTLYRPAGSNSELPLSYASFGNYNRIAPATTAGRTSIAYAWFIYGLPATGFALPATGTGTWRGIAYGSGTTGVVGSQALTVEGTSLFVFDFGASTLSGNLSFSLIDSAGVRTGLGTWALANPQLFLRGISQPSFMVQALGPGGGSANLNGAFYGPDASELLGTFSGSFAPPGTNSFTGKMTGAFAAKKQ